MLARALTRSQQYAQKTQIAQRSATAASTGQSRPEQQIRNDMINYLANPYNTTDSLTWPDYGIERILLFTELEINQQITILDFEQGIEESFPQSQTGQQGGSTKKQKGGVDAVGLIAKVLIKVLFELPEILENWSESTTQAPALSVHAKNMDKLALLAKRAQTINKYPSFFVGKQIIETKAYPLRRVLRTEYPQKIKYAYETDLKYYQLQPGNVSGAQYATGDQGAIVDYTMGDLIFDTLLASGVVSEASYSKHAAEFSRQTSEDMIVSSFLERVKGSIDKIKAAKSSGWKWQLSRTSSSNTSSSSSSSMSSGWPGGGKPKRKSYDKMTRAELIERAKAKKIKGYSKMRKADIITALRKK